MSASRLFFRVHPMMCRARIRHIVVTLFTATIVGGCGGEATPVVGVPKVAFVVVTTPRASLAAGKTLTATATIVDATGAEVVRPLTWSSSNPAIATVSPSGVVQTVAPGEVTLSASAGGVVGKQVFFVTDPRNVTLSLTPLATPLTLGSTRQLALQARDPDGDTVTPPSTRISYVSLAPNIVSVAITGMLTATGVGLTTVQVLLDGQVRGGVSVEVTERPPASVEVTLNTRLTSMIVGDSAFAFATTRDSTGRPLTVQLPRVWSTSDSTIAAVDQQGLVRALREGTVTISILVNGTVRGDLVLSVRPVPVRRIFLSLEAATIIQDSTVSVTATLLDAANRVLVGRLITWSTSASSVAVVSPSGVITGVGPGSAIITASVDGRTADLAVTVLPRVGSITFPPADRRVEGGATVLLVATLRDASGTAMPLRPLVWRTSNEQVATVSRTGIVTALSAGTATITASREGVTGSVTVTVLTTLRVVIGGNEFRQGLAYTMYVERVDASGTRLPVRDLLQPGERIAYVSSDTVVAPILRSDTTNLFLAMVPGTTTITVSFNGLRLTVPVTVRENPRDICGRAVGSILLSDEETPVFLGTVSAPSDPLSIFNPNGIHGSATGALSINNPFGKYGNSFGAYSARNPSAANPPFMTRDGVASFFVTLRSDERVGTTPQFLRTCPLR